MFNVRIKTFYDAEQVQIFSVPLRSKGEVSRKKFDPETGEIYAPKRREKPAPGHWEEIPFVDEPGDETFVCSFEDIIAIELEDAAKREEYLRSSCARTINSIYDIARSNPWEWFFTFTFDPEKVNRYDYGECTKKFSVWLNNMRKVCPDMKYICVPEQHKDGAFHFHGLFTGVDALEYRFSGKLDKKGRCIYNIGNYNWGFTTATRIEDFHRASSYLCKYITKDLCAVTSGKKRYWASRNVMRPAVEEFLVEEPVIEMMRIACDGGETHVKRVRTEWTDVTYIDRPLGEIYTTNATGFSKAVQR